MKMVLLLGIIVGIFLTSYIIQNEASADQASGKTAWETNSDKVCGDKLCSENIYKIGKRFRLILYEPDLNLDSDRAESIPLSVITFESDNIRINLGEPEAKKAFDPKPSLLRETGDNTGVFYTVIEIPRIINGKVINFGERVEFEYLDQGSFASVFVGQNSEKSIIQGYISNLGAKIELLKSKINYDRTGQSEIPPWVKSNAKWWAKGISPKNSIETSFEYMINNGIIPLQGQGSKISIQSIPEWVKVSALLWSEGLVSDKEFIDSTTYLIKRGIILIN
jgi:hypothetical protein